MSIPFCVFVVFVLLAVNFPQSLGTEGFEKSDFKLIHGPTLCALETKDSKFSDVGKKLLAETDYSITDWKQKLNEGLGKHPVWDVKLVRVPLQAQQGFDYSSCDIVMIFKQKPDNADPKFVPAGMTRYDYDNKKASIEIYYLQVETFAKQTSWSDAYYTYTKTTWTPYYTGNLASDPQLALTIRHEIGHALGLGHYLVDDERKQKMIRGELDMPSIMVDTNVVTGNTHFSITPLDIEQLKSKYGRGGFENQEPSKQKTNMPQSHQNAVSAKCDASLWDHIYNPKRLQVIEPCKTVSGVIQAIKKEKDGDYHIQLKLDQQFSNLINSSNKKYQNGNLVVEPICQNMVKQNDAKLACKNFKNVLKIPLKGSHVSVTGSYVFDLEHEGWAEIHPVTSIEIIH